MNQPSRYNREWSKQYPLRILLAEDNAVNQFLMMRMLEGLGYRITVVGNGLEVLQALNQQSYDVIFMDVQMPGMDGFEATRRICSQWPSDARPRIVAVTANAMSGDRELCLEAGMDDYISKPFTVMDLANVLQRCSPIETFQPD